MNKNFLISEIDDGINQNKYFYRNLNWRYYLADFLLSKDIFYYKLDANIYKKYSSYLNGKENQFSNTCLKI